MIQTLESDLKGAKDLIGSLKRGSHQTFEELNHQYKRSSNLNLFRLVHQHEIAEELTHDVIRKIWQVRRQLDLNKSFPAFLRKIAANLAVDYYRRAALDKKMQEDLIAAATEHLGSLIEEIASSENQTRIHSALQKLPPRRRE